MRTFPLGNIFITRGASAVLDHAEIRTALARHVRGDWGEVCQEDQEANDRAVADGERLLSAYRSGQTQYWVMTEADRSATTILLPDEY